MTGYQLLLLVLKYQQLLFRKNQNYDRASTTAFGVKISTVIVSIFLNLTRRPSVGFNSCKIKFGEATIEILYVFNGQERTDSPKKTILGRKYT